MTHSRSQSGASAETLACDYLRDAGLDLVARNVRSRFGEIDLVMRDGATIVFVEVRYRRSNRYGAAAETIDARKQSRIRATAEQFLLRQPRLAQSPCRFDVLAVEGEGPVEIHWLQNAF